MYINRKQGNKQGPMEIWLDTADVELISLAKQMGILYGVTTNPSIIAKSKLELEEILEKILKVQNGPVTVQVTAQSAPEMIRQGEAIFQFSNRIVVKIPVTAEGLKGICALSERKIPTMATAIFDLNQVLLAARAGASYLAPYFSTICEADQDGLEHFKSMYRLLQHYQYNTKLIAASLKSSEQVRQCVDMGVHAVTINPEVFNALIENHPETLKRLDRFNSDWKSAQKRKSLPL